MSPIPKSGIARLVTSIESPQIGDYINSFVQQINRRLHRSIATCNPFRVNPSPVSRSPLTIWIVIKLRFILCTITDGKKKTINQLININYSHVWYVRSNRYNLKIASQNSWKKRESHAKL